MSNSHARTHISRLSASEVAARLASLNGWGLKVNTIEKTYVFKNYHETLAFVNAVGWIAHTEDHHPDLAVSYSRCVVQFGTHSVQGLSARDFDCAIQVDALGASDA